jgi:hypothetical protein
MTKAQDELSDPWLTSDDLADYWKMSRQTLTNWRNQKKGPRFTKLATGAIRYKASVILDYEGAKGSGLSWEALVEAVDAFAGLTDRQRRDLCKHLRRKMWGDE